MLVWVVFICGLFSFMLVVCRVISATKRSERLSDEEKQVEKFIEAKEVFVRDPLEYKDVDNDGVDDIIDNK